MADLLGQHSCTALVGLTGEIFDRNGCKLLPTKAAPIAVLNSFIIHWSLSKNMTKKQNHTFLIKAPVLNRRPIWKFDQMMHWEHGKKFLFLFAAAIIFGYATFEQLLLTAGLWRNLKNLGLGQGHTLKYQFWRRRTWSWLTGQNRKVIQSARPQVRESAGTPSQWLSESANESDSYCQSTRSSCWLT